MGNAASSALRIDENAYGSLEGLGSGLGGGVRKLKKKPVLVLDPEELAQAHAAFHEASAEQLGETVERAPRPAMILGLAPMDDDDAEEMGQADDVDEDADTGQPSAEAVLSLTRRKSAPMVDDTGPLGLEEDYARIGDEFVPEDDGIGMGPIERLGTIEDGLDIANRIFPTLSLRSGTYHEPEDEQRERPVPPVEQPPVQREEPAPSHSEAPLRKEPEETALQAVARRIENKSRLVEITPPASEPPVTEPDHAPVEEAAQPETASPAPVRFDELNPAKDYEAPDEVYDLDAWLSEEDAIEDIAPEHAAKQPEDFPRVPEAEIEPPAAVETRAPVSTDMTVQESTTFTDDDSLDGYAFMRDQSPRRKVLSSAAPGQQSALRAKLLREAEAERAAKASQSPSFLVRLWNRLLAFLRRR